MPQNQNTIFWLPANTTRCWAWKLKIFKTPQHLPPRGVVRAVKKWLLYLLLMWKANCNENLALSSLEPMGWTPSSLSCAVDLDTAQNLPFLFSRETSSTSLLSTSTERYFESFESLSDISFCIWDGASNAQATFCFQRVLSSWAA